MEFFGLDKETDYLVKKIFLILKQEKQTKDKIKKFDYPEVFIVSPNLMRRLEKKFFKKNKEPEILSFEWPQNFLYADKKFPLGEIYINKKSAKNKEVLTYLLTHGILHLLGFDHKKKSDIIKMESQEKNILKSLKI